MKDGLQTYSVLGDSVSTFRGYTPKAGAFYGPESGALFGISSVEDTWWMQVIRGMGGELLVNDSWAGSTVCGEGRSPASSLQRIRRLGTEGQTPDCILVFAGLNDWAVYLDPAHFAAEYERMLRTLRQTFPAAAVYCGTFPGGYLPGFPDAPPPGGWRLVAYNAGIRHAAEAAGCRLADLAAPGQPYEAKDGIHPTGQGMTQLAQLWLSCLAL